MNAILNPNDSLMRNGRTPAVALVAALLLILSGPARGQDEFSLDEPTKPPPDPEQVAELTEIRSTLEIGIGYVSDDSFRFGRYTGLEDEGVHGVLNLDFLRRGPYDGDSAEYLRISASDLGLTSREAAIEYGRQGDFGIRIGFDQMTALRSDSAATVFAGAGTDSLTLPAGWVPATSTAGMTALASSLRRVDLQHERKRWDLGVEKRLSRHWTLSASFSHEDRDGIKSLGGVFGNSGGNPRSALLPEPIDYETQTFDVSAAYTGSRKRFQIRYHLSLFENGFESLSWQNPYSTISGWAATAGYPTGFGQMALPPDNRFHQLDAAASFDLTPNTRLTVDLAFGRMTQNEPFLPYTADSVLAASIAQPLPRDSLDGQVDTKVLNLRLTSRAGTRLHWTASFRYDDRDNQTPRDEFVYIGGDSQLQDIGLTSSRRRFNELHDFEEQRLRLDLGYRIGAGGRLTAVAERKETDRSYTEREKATEDTFSLGWNQDFSDWFSGSLRFESASRDGSTYHGDEPFLSGYSPGYTGTVAGGWENPPGLRKFHLADRDRDQVTLMATLTPAEAWSLGLEADWASDDYERSSLGLTRTEINAYSVDISYAPTRQWNTYAYYSYEDLAFGQNGVSISGSTRVADEANPARLWSARHADRIDTAGAGLNVPVIANRLEAGIELLTVRTRSEIEVSTGSALTSAALPQLTSRLHSFGLRATWRLRNKALLNLRYWYEHYSSTDWALDDVEANQLANVILLGESSPDYNVHVVTLSTTIRF